MHDLWSTVAKSSIMAGWAWSPLIYQAFERNRKVISPEETDSLPLLTLHLRRGDYADHCLKLAEWDSTYTGQSSFPEFEERDAFITPKVIKGYSNDSTPQPGDPPIVSSQDEKVKYYARHCYPDIRQVVERVREVVHDYESLVRDNKNPAAAAGDRGFQKYENWGSKERQKKGWSGGSDKGRESVGNKSLKRIFIMTNGNRELLQELKQALIDDAERSKISGETNGWEFEWTWEGVSTSRDLDLGWEEKPVGQALDMYIAQRSELFVGNGVSCLLLERQVLKN